MKRLLLSLFLFLIGITLLIVGGHEAAVSSHNNNTNLALWVVLAILGFIVMLKAFQMVIVALLILIIGGIDIIGERLNDGLDALGERLKYGISYTFKSLRHRVHRKVYPPGYADAKTRSALLKIASDFASVYTDEEEANRSLYHILKAMIKDIPIRYEPRCKGENVGDILIAHTIIKGKLSLQSKSEVDKLIGQIIRTFKRTTYGMKVIIYNSITPEAESRIKSLPYFPLRLSLIKLYEPTSITEQAPPQSLITNQRVPQQNMSEVDAQIYSALINLDSDSAPYRDEEEANRSLYHILKAMVKDSEIEREPRYEGNKIGDIRIGNVIIEGKLDLESTDQADRLYGQICRYCDDTPFKVRVVIYGTISKYATRRIERARQLHPDRISMVALTEPKRRRRE